MAISTLTTREKLLKRLRKPGAGRVVQYAALQEVGPSAGAVAAALSRLVQAGVVERVAKGSYRIPVQGRFGVLPVSDQQALKTLLQKPGQRLSGYPTGTAAFNRLGLTTQVPREIAIATPRPKRPQKVGNVRVRYVRSSGDVRSGEVVLRQMLDALKHLKRLPDTDPKKALRQLRAQIKQLPRTDLPRLARLARHYNPATRALLGAVLDAQGEEALTKALYKSLNALTVYRFGSIGLSLPVRTKWRIR